MGQHDMDGHGVARTAPVFFRILTLLVSTPVMAGVDLSGPWTQRIHEDAYERIHGAEVGDYTGLPINEAARLRAETWDAAKWAVPEHQCEPHPADYAPHGPASMRVWSEVDPRTQQLIAWHVVYHWMNPHRVIWMDGRAHPPKHAAHTWMGFSTGKWDGDTLVITTTHLKEGWIRRNGIPRSDLATLTEYWMRHGSYLTVVSVVEDPVYLTAPLVRSWNWALDLGYEIAPYACAYRVESDLPKGFVAHKLPGAQTDPKEFLERHNVPAVAAQGGAETMYPEYAAALQETRTNTPPPAKPKRTASLSTRKASSRGTEPRKGSGPKGNAARAEADLDVIPVRKNIYLITDRERNVTVQFGDDGVLLVDTLAPQLSDAFLATINNLSNRPIRHLINTQASEEHTASNARIAAAGKTINPSSVGSGAETPGAQISAHENVLRTMSARSKQQPNSDSSAWPTDTYFADSMEIYFNGEAVQLIHAPRAATDGDSIVHFRGSDVVSTGDIFSTTAYPFIDLEHGGSINGVINALNRIIDITIPARIQEGGTRVVPGHGRICDEYDVVIYRDMVTIIRDRIADLIRKGMTLEQVRAARPTRDYDVRYGNAQGQWTADQFIHAVYTSLTSEARQ